MPAVIAAVVFALVFAGGFAWRQYQVHKASEALEGTFRATNSPEGDAANEPHEAFDEEAAAEECSDQFAASKEGFSFAHGGISPFKITKVRDGLYQLSAQATEGEREKKFICTCTWDGDEWKTELL